MSKVKDLITVMSPNVVSSGEECMATEHYYNDVCRLYDQRVN